MPGPGYHEVVGNIAPNLGVQVASQFHSIKTRHFSVNPKPDWNTMFMEVPKSIVKNPGPGAYQPPSDFGYLTITPKYQDTKMKSV